MHVHFKGKVPFSPKLWLYLTIYSKCVIFIFLQLLCTGMRAQQTDVLPTESLFQFILMGQSYNIKVFIFVVGAGGAVVRASHIALLRARRPAWVRFRPRALWPRIIPLCLPLSPKMARRNIVKKHMFVSQSNKVSLASIFRSSCAHMVLLQPLMAVFF